MSQTSGMGFKRVAGTGQIPWFQRDKALLLSQGGYKLVTTNLANGMTLPGSLPLIFDEANRTATVAKFAVLHTAAANTDVTYQVNKGSNFKVGDYFAATVGSKAYAITAIDTSNADYDVITVGTTLGAALNPGQGFFASTATGASAAALPAANGLLWADTVVDTSVAQTVSAMIRGTVYARRLAFYSSDLAGLAGLKNIIFSQSY